MGNRRGFILSFVLVALATLLAYGGIVYAASVTALGEIRQDGAAGQWQLFQRAWSALVANQLQLVQDYAEREDVRAVVASAPPAAGGLGQSLAPQLESRHRISLLALADSGGTALYPTDTSSAQTGTALASAPARAAQAGKPAADVVLIADRLMIVAAAPVGPAGEAGRGLLLLGRPVDNALFDELKGIIGGDVALVRQGQLVATSRPFGKSEQELRQSCVASAPSVGFARLTIQKLPDGSSFVSNWLVDGAGNELGCLELDLSDSVVPTVRAAITIASLVAVLLGLAAAFLVGRALSGRLSASAEALAAGERENVRLYAEVQQLNSRLESLIDERTTQLHAAVSELQSTQSQLIRADRLATLGSLTAGVVNELSAPLTIILGVAQTLLRDETDAHKRADLEAVRQAALKSQDEVRKLHTMAGWQRVRRERVDLNEVVREGLGLLSHELSLSGIEPTLELGEGLPKIVADRTQAQQVLFNLVQRARRALESAGLPHELIVRTERLPKSPRLRKSEALHTEEAGEMVRLSILDNGPALEPERILHLFEPFAEGAPANADDLSLYVCRGIVESYGGRIYATNREDGPGAAFVVELP